MHVNQVIKAIRDAWKDAECSMEVDAALRAFCLNPEDREAKDAFVGRTWEEIPASVVSAQCPSPFLIGRIPLQYYLSAFLIAAARTSDESLLSHLIEFYLKPPKKPEKLADFRRSFDRLSSEQRDAVASFLRWARDSRYAPDSRTVRHINDALERYWGTIKEHDGPENEKGDRTGGTEKVNATKSRTSEQSR